MEKKILGWSEVDLGVDLLLKRLPGVKWKAIYGVPRGGIVLAGILAYRLNIDEVYSTRGLNTNHSRQYGEEFLIVDDIVDTGRTYKNIRRRFPNGYFATLCQRQGFSNLAGIPLVYSAYTIVEGIWVVFPWAPKDEATPGTTPV